MPILTCLRVIFYAGADEAAFSHFAKSIKAVQGVEGSGDSILLRVRARPSQESLRDLIALFHRYDITSMSQLASFLTDSNQHWFADPRQYWHRKVFGKPRDKQP